MAWQQLTARASPGGACTRAGHSATLSLCRLWAGRAASYRGWGSPTGNSLVCSALQDWEVVGPASGFGGGSLDFVGSETLREASPEFQALTRLQLQMLVSALEPALAAAAASAGDRSPSASALVCTAYCRSASSLQTGKLQLQLAAASDPASEAAAQSGQGPLFLGLDDYPDLAAQERWVVGQTIIVLPDSGGLVLPLAHGSFLVGLLVVKRAAGGEDGAGGNHFAEPSACSMFGGAELALLKQTAAALALACAMDLRAALERAGHALKQRSMHGLVQEARQPLTTLRTLAAMLAPRLAEGEPDRDLAEAMLDQGDRLQEVVSQLQAALNPAGMALPSQAGNSSSGGGGGMAGGAGGGPALRRDASAWGGGSNGSSAGNGVGLLPRTGIVAYPALPSSTIGSTVYPAQLPIEDEASPTAAAAGDVGGGSSEEDDGPSAFSTLSVDASSQDAAPKESADLLTVLMPLLASAASFAAASGIAFVIEAAGSATGGGSGSGEPSPGPSPARLAAARLPSAAVAVGAAPLKRLLAQLVDGVLGFAARGDSVEAAVRPDRSGVAVMVCCLQAVPPGAAGALAVPPSPLCPKQHLLFNEAPALFPEFRLLQEAAQRAGGWLEVQASSRPAVAGSAGGGASPHAHAAAVCATLWLPAI